MAQKLQDDTIRLTWVEPEIRELEVRETFALIGGGADVAGNAAPDCQRS